jgi:hypothetical protein
MQKPDRVDNERLLLTTRDDAPILATHHDTRQQMPTSGYNRSR